MFRQWLTLVIIVLVYIPVAIDATVLHVAAPTLSMTLGASGNELLWIIDIYSLVMAGMVLPMGALGDRIGFKRLLLLGGGLFGLASLAAAFAHSASWLIVTRAVLAIGAAMIVPATLRGFAPRSLSNGIVIWRSASGPRLVPAVRRLAHWLAGCYWSTSTGDQYS